MSDENQFEYLISDNMWLYDFAMVCKGVVHCKDITDSEFRTYCVILSMVNKKKAVAWPSYETIAELSGHSKRTVIRNVAKLESLDLIRKISRTGTSNHFIVKKMQNSTVLRNEQDIQEWMENHQVDKPSDPPPTKPPADEKVDPTPYKEIMDHLNATAGTKFSHKGSANQKLIKARWNEGFRIDDFKIVINVKTGQWKDTDMAQYLRPSTLFGNKFDQYRNENPDRKSPGQSGQATPPQKDWVKKFLEGEN